MLEDAAPLPGVVFEDVAPLPGNVFDDDAAPLPGNMGAGGYPGCGCLGSS